MSRHLGAAAVVYRLFSEPMVATDANDARIASPPRRARGVRTRSLRLDLVWLVVDAIVAFIAAPASADLPRKPEGSCRLGGDIERVIYI
jgi:hypothetical protein